MKLDDLQSPMNSVQLAQLLKKHHGIQLPVAQLTPARAQGMLESVQTQLNQYRNSKSAHLSEQDSNYTAMMLVEQTLRARVTEYQEPLTRKISRLGQTIASGISPKTGEAWRNYTDSDSTAANLAKRMHRGAKTGVAVASAASAAAAYAASKFKKRLEPTKVMESAMGEAEVILAAKDLADRVQDMVETLGKMINEELPALTETIRDTMEATQADTYNTSALESLNATLEAVRGSKESRDLAARTLAGEEPAVPVDAGADGMDGLGGDGTEPEPGAEDNGEVADELMNTPAVASGGKKQPLGRGKR